MDLTLTVEMVAAQLNLSVDTVRALVRAGTLQRARTPGGKKMLITAWSLLEYAGIPAEEARLIVSQGRDQAECNAEPSCRLTSARADVAPGRSVGWGKSAWGVRGSNRQPEGI